MANYFIPLAHAKDWEGNTPLHDAAYCGHSSTIRRLVLYGAFIDARNDKGQTPYHIAIEEGMIDVAVLLILYGAQIQARDAKFLMDIPQREVIFM